MSSYVESTIDGTVGQIVLNRPSALNALDTPMIRELYAVLVGWKDDDAVQTVLVRSASDKAFCAGGDIRSVRESVLADKNGEVYGFFSEEYRLNQLIADYPKPYVSLIDGVNMGGGLGISVHGAVRVVTERAMFAMPETAIGFIPDVGASWFLPRIPGAAGLYAGLTGARLNAGDALELGLATHFVPSAGLDAFAKSVVADGLEAALGMLDAAQAPESAITAVRPAIDEAFAGYDLAVISQRVAQGDEPWRVAAREALASASPWSLSVSTELLRRGGESATLEECLGRELRAAMKMTACPDFAEGVRAVLVDKDRNPAWTPAAIAEVSVDAVNEVFDSPI
ncbi:enoyl-CoA hydratase/isomerase family protein [Tomitella gaofuii]|uniref:enoyl-CoA hydratase/isomerase family protein n=1 Tax=Tomitella gaofuii TaxID=2760083 RepID=UPI0015F92391|nr:enoyl-CoA hydratase/isomerase family protein [Tomitella gaofuii]